MVSAFLTQDRKKLSYVCILTQRKIVFKLLFQIRLLKRPVCYCVFFPNTISHWNLNRTTYYGSTVIAVNVPFLFYKVDLRKNVDWINFRRLKETSSYSVAIYIFPSARFESQGFTYLRKQSYQSTGFWYFELKLFHTPLEYLNMHIEALHLPQIE